MEIQGSVELYDSDRRYVDFNIHVDDEKPDNWSEMSHAEKLQWLSVEHHKAVIEAVLDSIKHDIEGFRE